MKHLAVLLLLLALVAQLVADEKAIDAMRQSGGNVQRVNNGLEIEFHLNGRNLRDGQLAPIKQLADVTVLNLKRTKITDDGLRHLQNLTSLTILHLEQTEISDEGIAHLAKLTNLQYLNLYGTNITDNALPHLYQLKQLERLYVWQTKITSQGATELERTIPGLRVVRGLDLDTVMVPDSNDPVERPTATLMFTPTVSAADAPRSRTGENIEVLFENKTKSKIKLYWVGYNNELKFYGELNPNGTRLQNSYENNSWLITDNKNSPLGSFVCGAQRAVAVIAE